MSAAADEVGSARVSAGPEMTAPRPNVPSPGRAFSTAFDVAGWDDDTDDFQTKGDRKLRQVQPPVRDGRLRRHLTGR